MIMVSGKIETIVQLNVELNKNTYVCMQVVVYELVNECDDNDDDDTVPTMMAL